MNLEVLREIEKEAKQKDLPIIGKVKGKVLAELVSRYKPTTILEIGTLVGYSAIIMASKLKKGKLITIEIDPDKAEIAKSNIFKAGLANKIEVVVGDAKEIIPKLNVEIDMLFIDAKKEEYLVYLKLTEAKLKKGAIVVADNVKMFENRMKDYLEYVRNSGKYKSSSIDFGYDAMEISFKLE